MEYLVFFGLVAVAVGVVVRDLLKTAPPDETLSQRSRGEDTTHQE